MANAAVLDEELLVTDSLQDLSKRTPFQERRLEARKQIITTLLEDIEFLKEPTEEDIQLLLKETVGLGYSQKALAGAIGVTTGTLSRWISGENPPREFVREAIVGHIGEVISYTSKRLSAVKKAPTRPGKRPSGPHRMPTPER